MKILVTGAKGQLGKALTKTLADNNHQILGIDRDDFDITNRSKVWQAIRKFNPELIIHSAAMTDVDGCEEDPDVAYRINALGTQNLVLACQQSDIELLYISTDFVFSGQQTKPYLEFDPPNPISIYGKSKLAGEEYVRNLLNRYYIVRTSWLYGDGHNFVRTMLRLAKERDSLEVVDDQIGTPTYTYDLAKAITELIRSNLYGTYHASNAGSCTWYQFANKIFELKEITIKVKPITSEQLDRPAKRPSYSVLHNFLLENQNLYIMRHWEKALKDYVLKKE
ncbi:MULTISPECIES: dTDP-4-dehydrorhamnose reductase [unclassified Candidatus Frackibacter]|uniref:dTDP-4-dehydrorhamnose reductase n=1 Tax=unclassified Candidatus Frackibacter TaxID=2648818 RepID=UPI00079A0A55|nr:MULTISPECIES: dTDP-4-dehydrorhamnose reductase [unclassified Candidatus Frackibacter]KXS45505.1 MAG: dTDP-4-dehydrorhamnose reductase [Candidatus Frackibacter sp. T328-2]SDC81970.1 dTDP-4-dehydrorhamnose reductase [Candidatus Frackibacter sp. WG11]SEM96287.1 dTDP-4-dehydrorhamnose reductase [Candidatus Frackibacter sp. WG12]SFM04078.1 dTDP-4-dehydrorhamnose reductase [Candidatus Frackibacter sp. WG13]